MIYVIGELDADAVDRCVKIGFVVGDDVRSVKHRLCNLQIGNPRRLALLGVTHGERDTEREIHCTFESCHRIGEWFSVEHGGILASWIESIRYVESNPRERGASDAREWSRPPRLRIGQRKVWMWRGKLRSSDRSIRRRPAHIRKNELTG